MKKGHYIGLVNKDLNIVYWFIAFIIGIAGGVVSTYLVFYINNLYYRKYINTDKITFFEKFLSKIFFVRIYDAYYNKRCNSVIIKNLNSAKKYIELHFSQVKSGKILLFRNDLQAFSNDDLFYDLYVDGVIKFYNKVENIYIIVPNDFKLDPTYWCKIRRNIGGNCGKFTSININKRKRYKIIKKLRKLRGKISIRELNFNSHTNMPNISNHFSNNEALILYTSPRPIDTCEFTFIQRKYHMSTDLNILLVKSPAFINPEPFKEELQGNQFIGEIQEIFSSNNHWESLDKYAIDKIS